MKKNIGLIGLGGWGKNILRNLYDLGVLYKACDIGGDVIKEHKKNFPDTLYTTDIDDVINDKKIKAIAIAAPAVKHYEIARKAILAGKDVFIEKPLSLEVEEGKELIRLAATSEKIIMVGHILQYHPAVDKMKEFISSGKLGKLQYIYSNRLNIGKLRTEENILWSFAPHDISVILSLIGKEPESVMCAGGAYLNKNIYDTTMTNLEFEGDVKAHIFVSWLHPFKEQKFIVIGSKGMLVFDDMIKEKLKVYPHSIEWKEGKIPIAKKAEHYVLELETKEPLKEELLHFINAVEKRGKVKTDGFEALRVLKVLDGAEKSLASGIKHHLHEKKKSYFIHESSYIDENSVIGAGSKIWHFSHILGNTKIGENTIVGQNVAIGPDVVVGSGCKIQNNVSVYKGVTLEKNVFCGPSCVFTNVYNPRAFVDRRDEFLETIVGEGASIGANATVVCGNNIGKYAFIAAGAVVKSEIPAYAVVAGVPARQIGWVCECGEKLEFLKENACCNRCDKKYLLKDEKIKEVN